MTFLIGLLTVVMVLDCAVLILLILIQLPKKEAGAGIAFGGSAADALFGAGSGNVLTKVTKYATGIFFGLAIVLGVMQSKVYHSRTEQFQRQVEQQNRQGGMTLPPAAPSSAPAAAPSTTGATPMPTTPNLPATPAPAPAPANPAPTPAPAK